MNVRKVADFQAVRSLNETKKNQLAEEVQKASSLAANVPDKVKKSDTFHGSGYIKRTQQKRNAIADDSATKHLTQAYERDINSYKNLVSKLMLKQSDKYTDTTNLAGVIDNQASLRQLQPRFANNIVSLRLNDPSANIDGTTTGKYWTAENTAKRLLDFGVNLASGSMDKLKDIKNAAYQGFYDAESKAGGSGKLSELSYNTYEKLINAFDLELNK